jgi:pimeloyl-ACP methyl ester carboxylesterase
MPLVRALGPPLSGSGVRTDRKTVPSWYIVSTEDHAINLDLEHYYAKRIGATTTEIKASHVPFLSHPKEVARVIEAPAKGSATRR